MYTEQNTGPETLLGFIFYINIIDSICILFCSIGSTGAILLFCWLHQCWISTAYIFWSGL